MSMGIEEKDQAAQDASEGKDTRTTEDGSTPSKSQSLLHVPSRSSSQRIQPSPTTTGLSGATASDPRDSIGGNSKDSSGRPTDTAGNSHSFKILHQADFTIPVEIEGNFHNVYVIKRPGVDQFMKRVGELYEVVVFTASVSKYGDPLLDQLDIHKVVHHRLFRESCYNHQGNYVKDLSQVGRDLKDTIIIDNSPSSYLFHPQHAVPISNDTIEPVPPIIADGVPGNLVESMA
ncbi:hypothetical protein P8C59_002898 [Phyllachora maydis]|uniref:FCP1 homology domain-containing protein n=1 Tax=Phyllachora maydis TaxID=1825666 RepID=A0AAD9HZD2_9PEZI|nr:hypothetical protein P8C59_002898 [Phyllachora maydis]